MSFPDSRVRTAERVRDTTLVFVGTWRRPLWVVGELMADSSSDDRL